MWPLFLVTLSHPCAQAKRDASCLAPTCWTSCARWSDALQRWDAAAVTTVGNVSTAGQPGETVSCSTLLPGKIGVFYTGELTLPPSASSMAPGVVAAIVLAPLALLAIVAVVLVRRRRARIEEQNKLSVLMPVMEAGISAQALAWAGSQANLSRRGSLQPREERADDIDDVSVSGSASASLSKPL
jgi:hypothetical protein